jgi:hypothetical protein
MLSTASGLAEALVEIALEEGPDAVLKGLETVLYNLDQCKMEPLFREYVKGMTLL